MSDTPVPPKHESELFHIEHESGGGENPTDDVKAEGEHHEGTDKGNGIPGENENSGKDGLLSKFEIPAQILMAISTFAIVIATYYQSCNTAKQTEKIENQTDAIIRQTNETQRQTNAAESQLAIARDALSNQGFTDSIQREMARAQIDSFHIQLSVSRESMTMQLRAYVDVEMMDDTTLGNRAGFYKTFRVKNAGQTPAYRLTAWHWATVSPLAPSPTFINHPISKDDSTIMTLNPGCVTKFTIFQTINRSEFDAIVKQRSAIFMWGSVHYLDAFGVSRFTNFRYQINQSNGLSNMRPMERGNEAN